MQVSPACQIKQFAQVVIGKNCKNKELQSVIVKYHPTENLENDFVTCYVRFTQYLLIEHTAPSSSV